jgi:putative CocE/NonD family hydrolase
MAGRRFRFPSLATVAAAPYHGWYEPSRIARLTKSKAPTVAALLLVAAAALLGCKTTPWDLASAGLGLPEPEYQPIVDRSLMIPMRDGVRLAADQYRPKQEGRYPAVLIRTPYNKRNPAYGYEIFGRLLAAHGYVVIIQDVRGKYGSSGEFFPIVNEGADGFDTVQWICAQPWCDGAVGMFGVSYYGSTEWLAAPGAPDCLKTLVPVFTAQDAYRIWLRNGVFNFNLTLTWHYQYEGREYRSLSLLDFRRAIWSLPLISADDQLGRANPIYDRWITHPQPGEFWRRMSVDQRVDEIRCSALLVAGWFDPFLDAMLEDFNRIRAAGGSDAARSSQLIIGPWTHTTESSFRSTDFGKQARFLGRFKTVLRWYDYWLKGIPNGLEQEGPIRIFVMGRNSWRSEQEWPLARTRYTRLYLRGDESTDSGLRGGLLSMVAPGSDPPDTFVYDPSDPVPSTDQAVHFNDISYEPADQARIETRDDVLTYSTEILSEDVEITGPVSLVLYAASTGTDTDFTARLTDVYPDGRSIHVSSGVVRARFRDSLIEPSLIEPGRVYRYKIELGATSNLFRKGHRIRLQISSSDFPRHDRNLNTGGKIGLTADASPATQSILRNEEYPSHLVMPVIPPEDKASASPGP